MKSSPTNLQVFLMFLFQVVDLLTMCFVKLSFLIIPFNWDSSAWNDHTTKSGLTIFQNINKKSWPLENAKRDKHTESPELVLQ